MDVDAHSNLVPIVERVECVQCGGFHKVTEDTYFVVYGNIMVGLKGGIIGDNFNSETGLLQRASVFCFGCLPERLTKFIEEGD